MRYWNQSCKTHKETIVLLGGALFCLATFLLSLCIGAVSVSPRDLVCAIFAQEDSLTLQILRYSRLPRTFATMLAGAGLSVSGAVVQTVLHNKLASPGIIGVNAGAGLAVTLCCAAGVFSGWAIAGFSFLGAMAAVLLILFAAKSAGVSKTTLILGGVAVNSILNALSEAISVLLPEAGSMTRDFRVGGFYAVSTSRLIPAGILITLGLVAVISLCGHLDIIALGDETAHSLGVNVKKLRITLLVLAALLAGSSVSFSGLLGFVGLLVPHAVRNLVGYENRKIIPLCVLFGAGFVTICDLIARTAFAPYEIPVGIFLSVLGGPFFLYLLIRKKEGGFHD